jgi:polysaccharide biosynthesis protein PslH
MKANMELKILMVTPMPPQPQATGAIPVVLHAQLTGLQKRHHVTLVTVAGQEPGEKQAVQDLRENGIDVHAVVRQDLSGWRRWQRRWRMGSTWLTRQIPWRSIWFWEPDLQRILNHLFASREFDLVIVEDNSMGIYNFPTTAPVLFTEHEVRRPRPVDWNIKNYRSIAAWAFSEVDWKRWPSYLRKTWRKFDHIQVFSTRDADAIQEMEPSLVQQVSVNPFGIVLPEPTRQERENPMRLLFVGNYTHPPNVDAALWLGKEIMPRLLVLCPEVRLILVGIYPPPEILQLESDSIQVTGPVEDILPFMEEAAVVLAPVRIGGGMRMKVLHAMAMGKAVITTPRGAEGLDIWGKTPPIVIANHAEEFAQEAAFLLNNAGDRYALGKAARTFVAEHFSPQAYARRIEETYAHLAPKDGKLRRGGDG